MSEKSKVWTKEELNLFKELLKKYGTDFGVLKSHFPRKSKNQLKIKYKQLMIAEKKFNKKEEKNLQAVCELFREVS